MILSLPQSGLIVLHALKKILIEATTNFSSSFETGSGSPLAYLER